MKHFPLFVIVCGGENTQITSKGFSSLAAPGVHDLAVRTTKALHHGRFMIRNAFTSGESI